MSTAQEHRVDPRGNAILPPPPGTPIRPPEDRSPDLCSSDRIRELAADHQRLLADFDEALQVRKAAKQARIDAAAADIVADIDLTVDGKPPLKPSERKEPKASAAEAEADRRALVLGKAGRKTFDRLQSAVIEERDAWLRRVEQEDAKRADELRVALAAVRAASAKLSESRGARRWLGDVSDREMPNSVSHNALNVRLGRYDVPMGEVLQALSALAAEPEGPKTRVATGAEARFEAVQS